MPQISPMSWIFIILFFVFMMITVKSLIPTLIKESKTKPFILVKEKSMKW